MLNFDKNSEAGFAAQGDFGTIDAVDRGIASRGDVRGLDFTARDHTHLHKAETGLLWKRKMADKRFMAYAELG